MDRRNFISAAGVGASVIAFPKLSLRAQTKEIVRSKDGALSITSPGGNLRLRLYRDGSGLLRYDLFRKSDAVVEGSRLGVEVEENDLGAGVKMPSSVSAVTVRREYDIRSAHSETTEHCRNALVPLKSPSGRPSFDLEVRIYDNGLAFRYRVHADKPLTFTGEATSFSLPGESKVHFQRDTSNYEGIFKSERFKNLTGKMGMPVTFELPGGGYAAITEAALYDYSGMTLRARGEQGLAALFEDDDSWTVKPEQGEIKTPWRVVMVCDSLDGLVNCDIVYHVSPDPDPALFSESEEWIRPGRSLWSWWSEDTGDVARQKRYADAASRLGFEYILVDAGWEWWGLGLGKWKELAEVVDYSKKRGVDVWAWKSWSKLRFDSYRREFLDRIKDTGVVGVKIDYMDSESKQMIEFYEKCLRDTAARQLMVNFHGANKPAGESRTWPHEMTREGVKGLEYNRFGRPLPPRHNAILPFTRFLAGHGDYTPVTFDLAKLGDTSYAHQLALAITLFSPVTHYADRPENYLANKAAEPALPIMKELPTVWDQTVVLPPSKLGECAALARRKEENWYIGITNGPSTRQTEVDLGFLDDGMYESILLYDHDLRPDAFKKEKRLLPKTATLPVELKSGGGFVAMLKAAK
ncbi:MAG: glycoside hydrolase family 97 catalytic domain-containing protein [bacterium]